MVDNFCNDSVNYQCIIVQFMPEAEGWKMVAKREAMSLALNTCFHQPDATGMKQEWKNHLMVCSSNLWIWGTVSSDETLSDIDAFENISVCICMRQHIGTTTWQLDIYSQKSVFPRNCSACEANVSLQHKTWFHWYQLRPVSQETTTARVAVAASKFAAWTKKSNCQPFGQLIHFHLIRSSQTTSLQASDGCI